jgi:tetratricopeptide (TPR) repeat protein
LPENDDIDTTVSEAFAARDSGDWETAFEIFRAGLTRHPDDLRMLMPLACLYRMRHRYEDAIKTLRRAERLAPGDPHVLHELGLTLRVDFDPLAAAVTHGRLLELFPADPSARLAAAMTDISIGRPEVAADEVERLIAESPADLKHRIAHARLLVGVGRYTAALELLRRLLDEEPAILDGWLLRAEAAQGLLRTEEQNSSARRAFELLPDAPLTLYWMHAVALTDEADPRKARDYLRQAIAVHPRCVPAHVALGNLHLVAGQPELAAEEFATADKIGDSAYGEAAGAWARFRAAYDGYGEPDWATLESNALKIPYSGLPFHLGGIHLDAPRRDIPRAVRFLRLACECVPDGPVEHERCGDALLEAHKFDEAARRFRRAVELCPGLGTSWEGLGFALLKQERRDLAGAETAYERAVRLRPESAAARRGYGRTLLGRDEITGAITQLEAAIDLEPESGGAHTLMAVALDRADRSAEALTVALRARAKLPRDDDVAGLVAQLEAKVGS